jgi:hypothetical protein
VPSSPAGAAASTAIPPASSGAAALLAAGRQHLRVLCGSLHGWLDLNDCLIYVAAGQVRGVHVPIVAVAVAVFQACYCLALQFHSPALVGGW